MALLLREGIVKTQVKFFMYCVTVLSAIRECGGEQEFSDARREVAISWVRRELSHKGEFVDGSHSVVSALLLANAVKMGEPAAVAEVYAHLLGAWDHYEGAGRSDGKTPGQIA